MPADRVEKALKWIIPILQKHDIRYEISGGFAAHIYGADRHINDIDIDVDLSEDKLKKILPDIKNYITYGPATYKDAKWDLELKILLDYEGQLIDIASANNVKIYDKKTKKWRDFSSKFNTSQIKKIGDITTQLIDPNDLITYKKLLDGAHQKIDIMAVEKHLQLKKNRTIQ